METAVLAYVKIPSVHRVRMECKTGLSPALTVVVITALVAQTEGGVRSAATVRQAVALQSLRCLGQESVPQDFPLVEQLQR
jgi:hypothetical protein